MNMIPLNRRRAAFPGLALFAASALFASAQFPEPLLYYSFDEPGGSATVTDQSANNFNGIVVGNVVFGVSGAPNSSTPSGAAQFSVGGSTGIIDITGLDVPSLLGKRDGTAAQQDLSYTMACWVRPDVVSLSGDRFFVGQTTQGIHNGLRGSGQAHQAHWANDHSGSTQLSANEWVHVTFTYDGVSNTGTIYLNGLQDSPPTAKDGPNGGGNLILGGRQGGANGGTGEAHYVGLLDDFVVFQEVLSQPLISQLAAGASPVVVDDSDGDNLPDAYERLIVGSDDLTVLNGDGVADTDGDGLTDFEEFDVSKTNPLLTDTDDDGLEDGDELSDANGSVTDPLNPDSDSDGVTDGEEVLGSLNGSFGGAPTDPNNGDSDGDGSTDKYELDNGFDPNAAASRPEILLIRPSFSPIRFPDFPSYAPGEAGWDFEQNFYVSGVIFNNQAKGNYDVHTLETASPLSTGLSIQPFLDHGGGNTISLANFAFPEGGGDHFTVRANAFVEFTQGGNYLIHHGSDDTIHAVIDTGADSPVIVENNCCPADSRTPLTIGAPGFYPVDFVFGEQGGGEWLDLGISGPGINGTVALGNVTAGSPAVFLIDLPQDDSDGDSLPDVWEEKFSPGDLTQLGSGDFDADGVDDPQEYLDRTDPTEADTDLDGLEDGDEKALATNPLDPDTDNDGLLDGDEVNGTGGFVSNPRFADSDGDGFDDGVEILNGSDPGDPASVPAARLPIVDDFEDGLLNQGDWTVNLNNIPAGANVIEQGGQLQLINRGHLVTRGEFDPELVGGLSITGEWTFGATDDMLQILTRSDGEPDPANCCGETTSGIEFFAYAENEEVQIRTRGGDLTVGNVIQDGAITLDVGATYEFSIIDDGLGQLSFSLQEQGNPANSVSLTAELTMDNSPNNHIVFHNREGGRTSYLESVTIASLVEEEKDLRIEALTIDEASGEMSLTWNSEPGETFRIAVSANLQGWGANELIDAYGADNGESTTYRFNRSELNGLEQDGRLFFRVEKVE